MMMIIIPNFLSFSFYRRSRSRSVAELWQQPSPTREMGADVETTKIGRASLNRKDLMDCLGVGHRRPINDA